MLMLIEGTGEGHLRAAIHSVEREIKVQHSLWTLWIAFSTIKKVRSCPGEQVNIYITTRSPPQLYQRLSPEHALVRATEFPSPAEDRLGACTVCCLTMHHSAADSMLQQLAGLPCIQRANRATRGGRRPGVERKPSVPVVQCLPEELDFAMNVDGVHDDLRYGLGCLLSANLLHAANVSSQFLDELRLSYVESAQAHLRPVEGFQAGTFERRASGIPTCVACCGVFVVCCRVCVCVVCQVMFHQRTTRLGDTQAGSCQRTIS
jgi:hypothetical protein